MRQRATFRPAAGFLLVFSLLSVVPPAPAQPAETSFYASIGTFGSYGEITRELLGEDMASSYENDPGVLLEFGAVVPLAKRWTLDLKLSLGTAQIERRDLVFGPAEPLVLRTEADLQNLSLDVGTKIYLRPNAPCFQPWLSAALRTTQSRAENGMRTLKFGVFTADGVFQFLEAVEEPLEVDDVTTFEPVLGTGFEWPLKKGLILNVDANYGLETGWRLSTGFRFGGGCCGGLKSPTCSAICDTSYDRCTRQCRRRGERFRERCGEMCTQRYDVCTGRCEVAESP